MAYSQVDPNINNMNPADRNSAAIRAGYTGWDDYLNNRASTQSSYSQPQSSTTVTPTFSADDLNKAIAASIKTFQDASQPAIASYQASIPETKAKYAQASSQLIAQQQPLKDRYTALLESIKNEGQQTANKQTLITSNELGKRGILGSSTMAQQEIQNAVTPVQQQYATLQKNAALDQTQSEQALQNSIVNLVPQETADTRAIQNAIAALQGGAVTQGAQLGSNLYGTQLQNTFANAQLAQQKDLTQQQYAIQQQQNVAQNAYNQAVLQNTQAQQAIANALQQQQLGISGGNLAVAQSNSASENALRNAQIQNLTGSVGSDLAAVRAAAGGATLNNMKAGNTANQPINLDNLWHQYFK